MSVDADAGNHQTDKQRHGTAQELAFGQRNGGGHGKEDQRKHFRRTEFERKAGCCLRKQHHHHAGDDAADEGGDCRSGQRRPRSPLLGHFVTIEAGHNGGGIARRVDHDRGNRAAEHRTIVNGTHADEGRRRIHAVGNRNQNGDTGRRTNARQHADQGAEETADHHPDQVGDGQCILKTQRQIRENCVHVCSFQKARMPRGRLTSRRPKKMP